MSKVLLAGRYLKREMSTKSEICSILRGGQKSVFQVKLWGKTRSFNRGNNSGHSSHVIFTLVFLRSLSYCLFYLARSFRVIIQKNVRDYFKNFSEFLTIEIFYIYREIIKNLDFSKK